MKDINNGGKNDRMLYRRYSIRYSLGDAILPKGYGTELSLLQNPDLQGKTLNQVADMDGPHGTQNAGLLLTKMNLMAWEI